MITVLEQTQAKVIRGRGASQNPVNRFEPIYLERNPEWDGSQEPSPKTEFFADAARSIITYNDSPDVGVNAGINPYRGCEHGCVYCFARPSHEYFGLSAGLDFETKIFVKKEAARLLRKELSSPKWMPQVISLSGNVDCYQPAERHFGITRQCLEVLAEFRNPVAIITKNKLVTRDIDILKELSRHRAVSVFISVTTLDKKLAAAMEPRASCPQDRLATIEQLTDAGISAGALVAPVIPGLTDHEVPQIIRKCAQGGAQFAGYVMLRLPFSVKDIFQDWLTQHFPDRKEKVLNRLRQVRGGRLNDPRFGTRLSGEGVFAEQVESLFMLACKKAGIGKRGPALSTASFKKPGEQLMLF